LHHAGEVLVPHHCTASPETCLTVLAPYREERVVAVACLFPWSWLADWGKRAGMACVLGPALSMPASQGGTAQNARMDAQTSAGRLRGGRLPPASGYPAAMRARRDLLWRRMHCRRQRAEWRTHGHTPQSQDTLPAMGKQSAAQAHCAGVAERCAAPAGQQRLAVALSLRRTVPGSGARLSLVRL
jgi:hypothetical protein